MEASLVIRIHNNHSVFEKLSDSWYCYVDDSISKKACRPFDVSNKNFVIDQRYS